ncbi:cation diffusion facilitator family transporter [Aureimonas sp. AU12]|uniref:cation diffusion facilitator family transporter n=1 Tax=Aureimonas sp. AU12 TaxID=1638161 RepID=UPI000782C178|nr:cation diffusion facilitator family transporter [Aureimonas sp. AU12]
MSESTAEDGSRKTVVAAIGANLAIAATKFAAAFFTGSASMLAEGIHSLVDTTNEGFLLLGIHRSKRPADAMHPFGYGTELYFWAFIIAILIFALGSGFSLYDGIGKLVEGTGEPIEKPAVALGVLALSFIFEGYSWRIAFGEFQKLRGGRGIIQDFRDLKDPSIFIVLCEDSAALVGILIAAAGIGLALITGNPLFDAAGSVVIGLLLAATAWVLAVEVKGLLIGEAASPAIVEAVREGVGRRPEIAGVNEIRTLHRGPNDVLLTMSVDFEDDILSQDIEAAVSEIEERIRTRFPIVRRIYIEVQSKAGHRSASRHLDVAMSGESA